MPKFTYVSRDLEGQRITAVAEAETRQDLLVRLKSRGLTVVEITERDTASPASSGLAVLSWFRRIPLPFRGVSGGELAVFWRQLATMIAAGLPIIEALQSIEQEIDHKALKNILRNVVANMWEGMSLSQSMRRYDRVFSPMVVALIGAAEESGSLPRVTQQIAGYLENRDNLLRKVRAALTYPIFVIVFFFGVLVVSAFWIIPRFRDIYDGFGTQLPLITEVVFAADDFFLSHFHWIVLAIFCAGAMFTTWARRPEGRAAIDRLSLRLPVFGELLQRAAVARLCRSLAILLAGGVPINRALEIAENVTGNSVIAASVRQAREDILKGGKVAASFRKQEIFPKMAVRMMHVGEETGNMTDLLEKAAEYYESRVDAALTTINTLIEPVIIILIGIFVLVFVLALYMPIFSLGMKMKG